MCSFRTCATMTEFFPAPLVPIDGRASGDETAIVAMHREPGGELLVVLVQHDLHGKPAFAPVALDAVVVDEGECEPALGIDGEGVDKVAEVWIACDANDDLG